MNKLYGGIEAGGTKFICILGNSAGQILTEARIPTTTPQETLQEVMNFFRLNTGGGELASLGIGSFGPLDLDPHSPTYGSITTTPKTGWAQVDLCGALRKALNIPVDLDTDVNTAALGEHFWIEENNSLDPFLYVTVGTGIGTGVLVHNRPLHGLIHPEAGHAFIPHSWAEDPFEGICPYHGNCLEGLASGPAIELRWGVAAEHLPTGHPGWELEARYLALGICNMIYTFSPQRIVLGGGVLQHPGLIDLVREQVLRLLNGYIQSARLVERIDTYLVRPGLGNRAGVLGALALALTLEDRRVIHENKFLTTSTTG